MIAYGNSIVQLVVQIKNGIMEHVNVSVKIIAGAQKIIAGMSAFATVVSI